MLNELVGRYLNSADGSDLLKNLTAKGLTEQQATQAVTATAEGAVEQGGAGGAGAPDLASLAGGLLGGGGLGALGGLFGGAPTAPGASAGGGMAGMLGGLMGGNTEAPASPGTSANPLAALIAPISQVVAQKTGLAPALAQMVVTAALPKLLALFTGAPAAGAKPDAAPAATGPADLLSSLLR